MEMTTLVGNKPEIKRIALAYEKAPNELPLITEDQIHELRTIVSLVYNEVSSVYYFDFAKDDPYKYERVKEMIPDFKKGVIRVNTSGNNSDLWGPVYNLLFRGTHDYIHAKHLHEFHVKDEIIAYLDQIDLSYHVIFGYLRNIRSFRESWELYKKVLRSEIIYQACVKTYFKEFHLPVQKIILQDL